MHPAARLADLLDRRRADLPGLSAVAGFDGSVDERISVLNQHHSAADRGTPLASMSALGAILAATAGSDGQSGIVMLGQGAGGCAVDLGDGLATLGVSLDYFGTVGRPRHPAFTAFAARCRSCTAWGASHGRSYALEFPDGTFFLSPVDQLAAVTPDLLVEATADGAFARACAGAGLIALTHGAFAAHLTAAWRWLQEHVLSGIEHRPWLFLDLADPSGSAADVQAMLGAVGVFERTCRTVYRVDHTGVQVIAGALGLPPVAATARGLGHSAAAIRTRLGISQVVITSPGFDAVATAAGVVVSSASPGAHPRPEREAGFNVGYCLGLLLGLEPEDGCRLGSATAACRHRTRSADLDQVIGWLRAWADGHLAAPC